VVTITITPDAFAAIASILPKVSGRPDDDGGYLVTLDQDALDRLRAGRRRGESYSDVILRLAKG
jgi:predicted CopG family antitoxin